MSGFSNQTLRAELQTLRLFYKENTLWFYCEFFLQQKCIQVSVDVDFGIDGISVVGMCLM